MSIQILYLDTRSALTGHPEGGAALLLPLVAASILSASTSTALYDVLSCLPCLRKGLKSDMASIEFTCSNSEKKWPRAQPCSLIQL